MLHRERLRRLIARKSTDRTGFWLGNPHSETWPRLSKHLGIENPEAICQNLGDELRWICPQWNCHRPPGSTKPQPLWRAADFEKACHGAVGPLANCQTAAEVERFPWPNPDNCDFSATIQDLKNAGDVYRAGGMWTCFYHDLMDLFGMEEYLIAMHERPAVVEAATDKVCSFYFETNKRFLIEAGDEIDAFFLGNDFGTQLDTICSPEQFDRFIMPWFRRYTDLAHAHGKQVILHSCGSIARVIDRLIDAGVDCLHPLQAKATGMEATELARRFGGKITFMGGVDTQELLPKGTPQQVADEVARLRDVLGPNLIISPSHEAILPDVPPENIVAMARAATK